MKNQAKYKTHRTPTKSPNTAQNNQYAEDKDESPPLSKEETKYVQVVAGTLLYYGRAVENTILTSLSSLTTKQAKQMQKTMETVKQ
jgi:hypothetical protein